MRIPPEHAGLIRKLLDDLLSGRRNDGMGGWSVAALTGAFPLYADFDGIILLRPDGRFLLVLHDDLEELPDGQERFKGADKEGFVLESVVREETRPWWCILALTSAIQGLPWLGRPGYPELQALLPLRPEGTLVCATCQGRGTPRAERSEFSNDLCWRCAGLGWVAEGVRHPAAPSP